MWCALALAVIAQTPPAAEAASATTEASAEAPSTTPEPSTAPARTKVLRIAVQDPTLDGVPERLDRIFPNMLVAELRKLDGVAVIGLDECARCSRRRRIGS